MDRFFYLLTYEYILKGVKSACSRSGNSKIYVPKRTFYLDGVEFVVQCKSKIEFVIDGTLLTMQPAIIIFHLPIFLYTSTIHVSPTKVIKLDGQKNNLHTQMTSIKTLNVLNQLWYEFLNLYYKILFQIQHQIYRSLAQLTLFNIKISQKFKPSIEKHDMILFNNLFLCRR